MRKLIVFVLIAAASNALCAQTDAAGAQQTIKVGPSVPDQPLPETLPALPDDSYFRDPPFSDTLGPAPDLDEQRRIMHLVVDYVGNITHRLPNFFADRTTIHLEDRPRSDEAHEISAPSIPPRVVSTARARVTYRNGKEDVEPLPRKSYKNLKAEYGLNAWGVFGPILDTVIVDAARSTFTWAGWTQDPAGPLAVFRYSVPMEHSNYGVKFCCVPTNGAFLSGVDRRTAYHGILLVEPETGLIRQLTLQADLNKGDLATLLAEALEGYPLQRADLWIQYGPVQIAGRTYNLPLQSVAISCARTVVADRKNLPQIGPLKTFINKVTFSNYHEFRSESRIITSGTP